MKQYILILLCPLFLILCGFTNIDDQSSISKTSLLEEVDYEDLWSMNITDPSGLTKEELEQGLKYVLKDYADIYIEMENQYQINAVFLAAKDALESGWGRYAYYNNLSGWGSTHFDNPEQCIEHVSEYIKIWYLTEPHNPTLCDSECKNYYNIYDQCTIGQYYNGTTIHNINAYYNGRTFWEQQVVSIMYQIYHDSNIDELDFS